MSSQLETIADLIPGILWIMDTRNQAYVYVNRGVSRVVGYPAEKFREGGGAWVMSLVHPDDLPRVMEKHDRELARLSKASPEEQRCYVHEDEYRVRHQSGNWVWIKSSAIAYSFDSDGSIREVLGIGLDITREKEAEAKARASEKLASAGLLAAEIVHEINNPLSFVTMSIEMALEKLGKQSPGARSGPIGEAIEVLKKAHRNAERISKIVRHLKTFSRVDDETLGVVDVHQAIEASLPVFEAEFQDRARLIKDYGDVQPVIGNEPKLAQVLMNLVHNALHSLESGRGGEVRIRTHSREIEGEHWVVIEVSDNGVGIPPEILSSIFDPFFTTRPIGLGTGLGLTISQGIVKSFGGRIEVSSQPGEGSCFRVFLKRATQHPK